MAFIETGDAYVIGVSSKIPLEYFNLPEIFNKITVKLDKLDFNFIVLNRLKFKRTRELLQYLNAELTQNI